MVVLSNQLLFTGTPEDDVVSGTSGTDYLYGSVGNDTLRGLAGFDILRGSDGSDTLFGGTGSDGLDGLAGNDQLSGEADVDNLRGGEGVDRIDGGDGNDIISGGGGGDILTGGPGADIFSYHGARESRGSGTDQIQDFDAQDRIDLSSVEPGAAAFTFIGGATFTEAGQIRAVTDSAGTHIQINTGGDASPEMSIDLANGAAFTTANLILTGNPNHDFGFDTVTVGDGGDILAPVAAVDVLEGGAGNDYLYGGLLDDTLHGGADNDDVRGGEGNDTLFGDEGHDVLDGSLGNDVMSGGDGNDILRGQAGADQMDGGTGDDHIDGGAGNDTIVDNDGFDEIFGGAGNDNIIVRGLSWSTASGDAGNDIIVVGDNGVAYGGAGADILTADLQHGGYVVLDGGSGVDRFNVNTAADETHGIAYVYGFDQGREHIQVNGTASASANWASLDANHDGILSDADTTAQGPFNGTGVYAGSWGITTFVDGDEVAFMGIQQINRSDWIA